MLNDAVIIGRTHRLTHQNCHDAAYTGAPQPGYAFGLVLDGCGSKFRKGGQASSSHNEVGAKLLGQFAGTLLHRWLSSAGPRTPGPEYPMAALLDDLYQECLAFLGALLDCYSFASAEEHTRFLATNLLCTLIGFVITPDEATFFWSGDGYLCTEGEISRLDHFNQPDYLAYQLTADHELPEVSLPGFQKKRIAEISETNWLAVATDGWNQALVAELRTPRPGLGLQRWLNVQARKRGVFDDDGAVAIWRRSDDQIDTWSSQARVQEQVNRGKSVKIDVVDSLAKSPRFL